MWCSGMCNLFIVLKTNIKSRSKKSLYVISQSSKHPGCPYLIDKYGRPGHDCSCVSTALGAKNATIFCEAQNQFIEDFSVAEFSHKHPLNSWARKFFQCLLSGYFFFPCSSPFLFPRGCTFLSHQLIPQFCTPKTLNLETWQHFTVLFQGDIQENEGMTPPWYWRVMSHERKAPWLPEAHFFRSRTVVGLVGLIGWLVGWLFGWLVVWLFGCLVVCFWLYTPNLILCALFIIFCSRVPRFLLESNQGPGVSRRGGRFLCAELGYKVPWANSQRWFWVVGGEFCVILFHLWFVIIFMGWRNYWTEPTKGGHCVHFWKRFETY